MHATGLRIIAVTLTLLAISRLAGAGPNELTTLPLHAVVQPASPPPCEIDDPCDPGPPTTTVPADTEIGVYLLARNFDNLSGVQTAFDWGDWNLIAGHWDCQSNQITGTAPHGAGGAAAGTIATAFDCVLGPSTVVIGSLRFNTTASGCLTQVESAFPYGTHVVSCNAMIDAVEPHNRGAVCVAASGFDACEYISAQAPICDAGGPHSAVEGEPVLFDGTGSSPQGAGAIVSYEWEFGDGETGSGATTLHAYAAYGDYTVTLTVTDDLALWSSCSTTAAINAIPECNTGGPYADDVCTMITFDGSESNDPDGTIVAYVWEFGDGHAAAGAITSHHYAEGGIYTVTLTVTDDVGAVTTCATTADIDGSNPPPQLTPVIGIDPSSLDFSYFPLSRCIYLPPLTLSNDVADPCSELVVEDLSIDGADFFLVAPPPTPIVINGDGSVVTLKVGCCPSMLTPVSGTLIITATGAPNSPLEVPLTAAGNLLPVCDPNGPYTGAVGELITFDGSHSRDHNGVITSYAWEFGDGHSAAGAVVLHAYQSPNSFYLVTLCATDDQGGQSCCETHASIEGPISEPQVDIDGEAQGLPRRLALHQCRPNPFNPSTTITFELPAATRVALRIYDSTGRRVRTLVDRELTGGIRTVTWNGLNDAGQRMGSGVYVYGLHAGGRSLQRKMILIR